MSRSLPLDQADGLRRLFAHARVCIVPVVSNPNVAFSGVMLAYRAPVCAGVVLSKLDEAVKLGPALDALIRNKLKLVGVANGQRVPEDWHRLSANALVQRALRGSGSSAYKFDASDVSLIFTAPISHPAVRAMGGTVLPSTVHA